MKHVSLATRILIVSLLLIIPSSSCAAHDPKTTTPFQDTSSSADTAQDRGRSGTQQPMPAYTFTPPQVGVPAPTSRIGGASRTEGLSDVPVDAPFLLAVLAPNHVGLTMQAQPTLYWYLPYLTKVPITFTMSLRRATEPLVETRLPSPSQTGVQRVRLADYGIHLEPGVLYQWFVSLVPDPRSPSQDAIADGIIERKEIPKALQTQLAQVDAERVPSLYVQAGAWYDALAAITDLIDAEPAASRWRQQRAALLEQVGLAAIAKQEVQP